VGQGREVRFEGLELMNDPSPADWLLQRLRPWGKGLIQVASLVPDGYEAYGRVLHAAGRTDRPGKVRWSSIAEERGLAMGPEVRFTSLVGWDISHHGQSVPEPYVAPAWGTLEDDECARLAEVLATFTSSPERCWFCLWEGYGWPELPPPGQGPPRAKFRHRDCFLFFGHVGAACSFRSPPWFQSPTFWWPEDGAWCVSTEVDGYNTYVAAGAICLDALVADPGVEVIAVSPEQQIDPSPTG
jgi:hypothetical protein